MREFIESLTNANVMEMAQDIRVIIAASILFLLAAYFRWKTILVLLVAFAGTITVVRFTHLEEGAKFDQSLVFFGIGTIVVAVVMIYILFIQSD